MANKGVIVGNWNSPETEWEPISANAKRHVFTGEGATCVLNVVTHVPGRKKRPPHKHIYEQIVIILEGDGDFIVDGVSYPVKPGTYIVIPPNVEHAYDPTSSTKNVVNLDIFTPKREEYIKKRG